MQIRELLQILVVGLGNCITKAAHRIKQAKVIIPHILQPCQFCASGAPPYL